MFLSPHSELFQSAFSRIRTEYGPQQLRIRTLFTQCYCDSTVNAAVLMIPNIKYWQFISGLNKILANYKRQSLFTKGVIIYWEKQSQVSLFPSKKKQPLDLLFKIAFLKNFAKFTGKHLCQNLFLNKAAGLSLHLY